MQPEIKTLTSKRLIGKRIITSLSNNKTFELWKSFMPKRNEIKNVIGTDLYSIQNYNSNYFKNFSPTLTFEKWAAVEVSNTNEIPNEMEIFTLAEGLYAVFFYKGLNSDFTIFDHIFRTWLPNSEYDLDQRPHFEVMGAKYKNNDPESEEEIWVPIKKK
ncbi:MAG TPA: GyrI-like domain-containing protein [Bacteroidia bacterium]|jgi:AraC family transcriptional regulator|nr:GyrI-like domain-containing protein [Bacteroidia bacterium]